MLSTEQSENPGGLFGTWHPVLFQLCSTESKEGYLSISRIHKCEKQDVVNISAKGQSVLE